MYIVKKSLKQETMFNVITYDTPTAVVLGTLLNQITSSTTTGVQRIVLFNTSIAHVGYLPDFKQKYKGMKAQKRTATVLILIKYKIANGTPRDNTQNCI